jgi:pantetheine-phosphate adenylyltransferase
MLLLFPGSFDPLHLGHLDLIRRGSALADELVVAVGVNPDKKPLLDPERRVALLRAEVADLRNVRVESYEGATLNIARRLKATALLRGVRNIGDFELEETMAAIHRSHGLDTIFLMTDGRWAHVSATAVKLARSAGLPLNGLVPPAVAQALERRS